MDPLYFNVVGGIKLQVLEENLEKAIEVLKDFESENNS